MTLGCMLIAATSWLVGTETLSFNPETVLSPHLVLPLPCSQANVSCVLHAVRSHPTDGFVYDYEV
jgi:hypothetical protein